MRGHERDTQRRKPRLDLPHALAVDPRALLDVRGVLERRDRGGLGQRIHVERLADAVEEVGHRRVHHAVAHAQRREPVGLRERARDDQVRVSAEPLDRARAVGRREVLVVGLVEHDDDLARHLRDERLDLRAADPGAGRVVRVRDEHDARARPDRRQHRRQVVPVVPRRHLDALRAPRVRRERVDGERVLRVDRLVAGRQERLRDELEHVVAAVAEHEALGRDAVALRERRTQREAVAVGIARDVGRRRRDRREHLRARAARVLVRRELDDARRVERKLAGELLDRLAGDVRSDVAHPGGRVRGGFERGRHGVRVRGPPDRSPAA